MMDSGLLSTLLGTPPPEQRFYGVTIAVVTNNQDPDGLGRVKVRFPWLSDQEESHWARVLTPMAGPERGLYFLPEVEDEVLVAFEHGQADYPYVLGALWNGQDKPPETNDDGNNNRRALRSRSGHLIRFDDTDGEEKIEIIDASEQNSILINTADNTITVKADTDITIQSASGRLILQGKGIDMISDAEITIEASQNLDIKGGPQLNINADMVNIN